MIYLYQKARDPMSYLTHFLGFVLSCIGLILLIMRGIVWKAELVYTLSACLFCFSAMLLYFASSLYHYYNGSSQGIKRLRKLDHAMIYVLIAGSYTPMCILCMPPARALIFLLIVWSVAILGIIFKVIFINAPRWLGTAIYLIMGWMVVFDWNSFASLPLGCLVLVALGGVSYSVGAIIYGLKKPNISKTWTFHEIFHVFIMVGTLLHYLAVFHYVV
ncbi:MAG: hemolysin III family protein [Erysipelotrichaceae bacterium]|nr:hemolysin III family protein [Erysipelotrichaceae bacterium]MBR3693497.1 hemolysin III family protein [Erysipelotrichales bacterium]